MKKMVVGIVLSMSIYGVVHAAPCGAVSAAQCASWCNDAESVCTVTQTNKCQYHNRSYFTCGYTKVVVSCQCTIWVPPENISQTIVPGSSLYEIFCADGVEVDENGDPYCVVPVE